MKIHATSMCIILFLCPTEYDNHECFNFIMTIDNNKFIVEQPIQ